MTAYQPRPYQIQAIADLRASVASGHRAPVLVMPTGCHAAGTEILMFDGSLRPVESIHVGDLVMGPDSKPRRVLALHRGEDEMFRVTPVKGDPFVVNGDHVLSLRTANDGSKWAGMVRNVTVREWLSASQNFRHVNKLYRVAVEFQPGDTLRVHPYLLGALIGDGCLGYGAALIANPDAEIKAEVTAIAAGCGLTVSDHKDDGRCPQYALVTPRGKPNPLGQAIRDLGLRCRSSHKFIPVEYKVASRHDRLELLAGLLDTDGHLNQNCYDFISASEALARDTAFVARSLGLAAYVKPCRKAWQNGVGDYWRVCISGDTDMIPCRVMRKQAPKRKQIKSVLVTGFKVEPIGAGEYFGFECDGDNLYLMGDFTVTHNSGKTICAAHLILGAVNKGRKVLFLSPRRELVFQTSEKLTALDVQHGIIMAGERQSMMPDVQIASIPTLFARYFRDHDDGAFARDLPRADLIVIDEIHAAMSSMTTRILAAYPNAVRVGLTATPARSDGRGLGEVCDDMVFGPSVADLTDMGMLVPLKYFGAEKADLSAVRIQAGDYHQTDLGEAMNKPKLVGDVVQNWLRLCPDRLTVVFAVNRAHAKALQDEFTHAGVPAGYIDGETPNDERHAIFDAMTAGAMRVLCSVDVVSMGWDMPEASCGIIARPTKSIARYLQMVGRIMRIHSSKDCLARGTLVLTDRGTVAIQDITLDHKLWDGVSFVPHGGAVCKGIQKTISYMGLIATPDHEVLTDHGWKPFKEAAGLGLRIVAGGLGGVPIRVPGDCVQKNSGHTVGFAGGGSVRKVFRCLHASVPQHAPSARHPSMSAVLEAREGDSPDMAVSSMPRADGQVPKQEERFVSWLRRQGNRVQVSIAERGVKVGNGKYWVAARQVISAWQDRQRWPLRAGEPPVGKPGREHEQYSVLGGQRLVYRVPEEAPIDSLRGFNTVEADLEGDDGRGNYCSLGATVVQTEREVWDIHNAGPLQRFTANNLIVHNCAYVIDHAGAVDELGFADDPQPWSLDGKSKIQDRKAAEKKEPKAIECRQCHRVIKPAKVCPGCGHDLSGLASKAIEAHQAELQEIDRKTREAKPKAITMRDKQAWWSGFLHIARDRGKSHKWVLAQYKSKFGVWPRGLTDTPVPPMPELVSWEASQRIRYAKGGR